MASLRGSQKIPRLEISVSKYLHKFIFFISWAPVGVCFHHGVYTKEHVDHIPSSCVPDCMCGARLHYAVSIIVGKMSSLCRVGRTSVVIVSLICYAPTIGSFVLVCFANAHRIIIITVLISFVIIIILIMCSSL